MNRYTIYCTESQTRKALALGAPIETFGISSIEGRSAYNFPTAEQMIGWLEEQLPLCMDICIEGDLTGHWNYFIGLKDGNQRFNSRKEATLAAIDAALEYLTNKK